MKKMILILFAKDAVHYSNLRSKNNIFPLFSYILRTGCKMTLLVSVRVSRMILLDSSNIFRLLMPDELLE